MHRDRADTRFIACRRARFVPGHFFGRIQGGEIDYARPSRTRRTRNLLRNRNRIVFGGVLLLFPTASATPRLAGLIFVP